MDDSILSETELLQRVKDLRKLGFTVNVQANQQGIILIVTKEKSKFETFKNQIIKFFQ